MRGGELVSNSLSLEDIKKKRFDNESNFENLPTNIEDYQIDEERTNLMSNKIGYGNQGVIFELNGEQNTNLLAKAIRLKKKYTITKNIIEDIIPSYYASNIGIGPKIYGIPFITTDGMYAVFIMDKVTTYKPNENDADKIINLFNLSINNNFITFDFEYAKPINEDRIIFLDFGISGIYESHRDTLKAALFEDVFANTGFGYYNPIVEEYFKNEYKNLQDGGNKHKIYRNKRRTNQKTKMHKRKKRTIKRKRIIKRKRTIKRKHKMSKNKTYKL